MKKVALNKSSISNLKEKPNKASLICMMMHKLFIFWHPAERLYYFPMSPKCSREWNTIFSLGFSCIENLNCINYLTTTGHLIYEAVNSAVNLFCWNENHCFSCFALNNLPIFYFIHIQLKVVALGLVTVLACLTLSSSSSAKPWESLFSMWK